MHSLIQQMEAVADDLYGHVHRVSSVARAIGNSIGLDERDLDRLTTVGILHDVGKIHISESIIAKPGPLDTEELVQMRRHPELGYQMTIDYVDHGVAEAILHHHERFDGRGYPFGLSKHKIPLLARVVLIADAFDAMTSHRSYQPALPIDHALAEIVANSGTQFDPDLVTVFTEVIHSGAFADPRPRVNGVAAR